MVFWGKKLATHGITFDITGDTSSFKIIKGTEVGGGSIPISGSSLPTSINFETSNNHN